MAATVVVASALTACSSNSSTGNDAPTLTLSAGTTAATVVQGGNVQIPLTIVRGGSFVGPVTLTATGASATTPLPTGLTANLVPNPIATNFTTATLTLVATTTLGTDATIPVTVAASGDGVTTQSVRITLTVTAR